MLLSVGERTEAELGLLRDRVLSCLGLAWDLKYMAFISVLLKVLQVL